ncbi:hypothetical protein ACFVIX_06495 [Bacillus subtilis]|uniref:hypothetical protein n=1 Tax=Bacillus subtilis group TaxID=653685 RepID=UPI0008287B37|nr:MULTISPECIES: hypothetical protein [Bacillus subtilis group]AVB12070.1 hypothetical protein C3438_21655 [Bacillus velezensis]AYK76615.1 hypothetical protein D9C12_23000 [Bacillus subtilis subsp. subtilis]AYL03245.1 hypothetical protein D9C08_23155 [Bacillus subtilis subsp. subtilis]MCB4338702.1 hypothetical protein [Bacillus subtilis]MCT6515459.1 hypothetical protein [Bacillus subtilis]
MTNTRRLIEHKTLTVDNEELVVVTLFEKGINKENAKKIIPYSRKHAVLIEEGSEMKFSK